MIPVPPRPDVATVLTAITGQMQLLQRRVLRADGLSHLERELLLGNVAEVLSVVQRLHQRLALPREPEDTTPPTSAW